MLKMLLLGLCGLVAAGCTNSPDALRMTLAPEKEVFAPGEPARIRVTLTAMEGFVCLDKANRFDWEVRREDGSVVMTSLPMYYCGTGFAIGLPLYPILASISLLDVADTMDRYTVLSVGEHHTDGFKVQGDPPLPAGRYSLRATLTGTTDGRFWLEWYPPPLFWRVYDQPVFAETRFVVDGVREDAEADTTNRDDHGS